MKGLIEFSPLDLIDIGVVAVLIYIFLNFIKGTMGIQMLIGLVIIILVIFTGSLFGLPTLTWLGKGLGIAWIVLFAILFQNELKYAFAKMGSRRFWRKFFRGEAQIDVVKEIVDAAFEIRAHGIGALIVIERAVSLENIVRSGRPLQALVSSDLISTIFTPYSPLHDGAIVIRGDMIVAAGCILPISDNPRIDRRYGMRHRAAVGITEQTDAICVVVSEETGQVSFVQSGQLIPIKKREELRNMLNSALPG